MKIEQMQWNETHGWTPESPGTLEKTAQLVLAFGATSILREQCLLEQVKNFYPKAHMLGCSTAGEILGTHVSDNSLVVTAVCFEHIQFRGAQVKLKPGMTGLQAGMCLAQAIPSCIQADNSDRTEELAHVLVLSDGLHVNGSELVRGLRQHLPGSVIITGGLAGDSDRFENTLVFWNDLPQQDIVAGVGFYGTRLRIGFGSLGGWDPFGTERLVTRSEGNVLYELDGHSALGLYKKYLGECHAKDLPAAGLFFPLSIRTGTGEAGVVRTVISIDEERQNMTFAGDIPEGTYARLMKANFDRLIDGAIGAARTSSQAIGSVSADLAILISCVGRKLVLKQRIEEEVEGVRDVLGERPFLTGFYSYGEISPSTPGAKCELHNQTMTITTFSEE